jgi:hypothetical protein
MKKKIATFLIALICLAQFGCQQSLYQAIHPSKPLQLKFYEQPADIKSEILIISSPQVGQKVGDGMNVGEEIMGEILVERTPKEIVTNRFLEFTKNNPQKSKQIETCEILKFSSYYENRVYGWWVLSEVSLKIILSDKREFTVTSANDGYSITPSIRKNLTKRLEEALNNCMSQIEQKL